MATDTMTGLAEAASRYADEGLYVLPLKPHGKEPLTANGLKDASNDPGTVAGWWERWPDANIGIACAPSGLVVVDIDRHGVNGFETLAGLERSHGRLPDSPLQATGGNGHHRIYRARSGAQYPGKLGDGVDLKHQGYIVVAPSVHPSGQEYRWVRTLRKAAEIPLAPPWMERRERPARVPMPGGLDWSEVQDALRFIPSDDRDTWVQVGMALQSTGHPAARAAWDAWSATSAKYAEAEQSKVWRSFKGDGTQPATIFALAQRNGWRNPKTAADRDVHEPAMPEAPPVEAYRDAQPPTKRNANKPQRKVDLVSAADITPVGINWLWPGWVAAGKLTVLAGAGGAGKTTLALALVATLTTGGRWPDGTRCTAPRNVVIWSSEDDAADTLVPRLAACGADLRRVHFARGCCDENGERQPFDPATDMDLLRGEVTAIGGAGMLLLDPLVSAVRGDMHRANDVRRSLQAVVDFAEEQKCAVLGISHFSKGGAGTSPADRVIGSQAFSALARTVLVAAKQEDGETRVLARAKSNISIDDGGVSYTIEPYTLDNGIETTRAMWGERIDGTARDILGEVEAPQADEDMPVRDVEDALRRVLRAGPVTGKKAKAVMIESGYTDKQIRRARERLGVCVVRDGFGTDMKTYWSIPDAEPADHSCPESPFVPSKPHSCPLPDEGTNGEKGHEWEKGSGSAGNVVAIRAPSFPLT